MDKKAILASMTLEEKFTFLTGAGINHTAALSRVGLKSMRLHDGPFGLRMKEKDEACGAAQKIRSAFPNCQKGEEVVSTAFPTGSALGATWDEALLREIGQAIGEEVRMYGVQAILGPAMNLKRHPLNGRNFEYFSEDPVLTGALAAAYVEGVQSQNVAACPKHFAMNQQERGRFCVSSEADERTMRELYLRPFEHVVKNARPWSIMCAYNRVNGVYASEHPQLLQQILRDEWGFDGIVVSDWDAVHDRARSLRASLELDMPYQPNAAQELRDAYQNGTIDDEMVDGAVERLLTFYERTMTDSSRPLCDLKAHDALACRAAREAIVLLKNDNQTLPVRQNQYKKILVLGQTALDPYIGGDGSSRVANPYRVACPLEELKKCLPETEFEWMGEDKLATCKNEIGVMEAALRLRASQNDAVIVFASQEYSCYSEALDRPDIELPPYVEHTIRACRMMGKPVIVVLNVGAAVSTALWRDEADAILLCHLGGQAMGKTVAETICGRNNPSGKLAETFPRRLYDAPAVDSYPGDGRKTVYREGLSIGYRHYLQNRITPDYAFGHGLSYTTFQYSDLRIDDGVLRFQLSNTGSCDGDEVAQLYVSFPETSWVSHPVMELKAFRRVHLAAGETKEVAIALDESFFTYYNTALHAFVTEAGAYTLRVGGASDDLPLSVQVTREGPENVSV